MVNDSSQCSALAATISAFVSPFKTEKKGDISEGTLVMEFNNSGGYISFLSMTANNDQYYVVYNPTSSSTKYQCNLPKNYIEKNQCSTLESYISIFSSYYGTNFTVTGSFSNGSLSASVSSNLSIVCTNSYTDCSCTAIK